VQWAKEEESIRDTTQCNFVARWKEGVVKLADAKAITECIVAICIVLSIHYSHQKQSLQFTNVSYITNGNNPEYLYVEEEDCYEVAGDWEEEYKL